MASYLAQAKDAVVNLVHSHLDPDADVQLPPGATIKQSEKPVDDVGLVAFTAKEVKHEILVKLNQLRLDDAKHGLGEVKALFDEVGEDSIQYYKPISYLVIAVPHGDDYIGKIQLDDEGHCIHVRVFSPPGGKGPFKFHSIDTRPTEDGGAVFKPSDKLKYFEY